jgi:hypothetical protein
MLGEFPWLSTRTLNQRIWRTDFEIHHPSKLSHIGRIASIQVWPYAIFGNYHNHHIPVGE